jgi:hypothetical protein
MRLHDLKNVSQFDVAHQVRVSEAVGRYQNKNIPIESEEDWNKIAFKYDKWWNRFQIVWNSDPRTWRALFTHDDLDVLVLGGWCAKGDDLYERMLSAMRSQDALKMGEITYQELNTQTAHKNKLGYDKITDALIWALFDGLRESPIGREYPFETVATLASQLSRNAMAALGNMGVVVAAPPDGSIVPDAGRMKSLSHPSHAMETTGPDAHILKGIYAWARLFIDEELRPKPEQP